MSATSEFRHPEEKRNKTSARSLSDRCSAASLTRAYSCSFRNFGKDCGIFGRHRFLISTVSTYSSVRQKLKNEERVASTRSNVFSFLSTAYSLNHFMTSPDVRESSGTFHSLRNRSSIVRYLVIVASALLASFKLNRYSLSMVFVCTGIPSCVLCQYFLVEFTLLISFLSNFKNLIVS